MIQTFTANKVALMDEPLGFGVAEEVGSGMLRHSLILCLDDEKEGAAALYVEFNDQSNACTGPNLALVELSDTQLRLHFKPGSRLRSGSVDACLGEPLTVLAAVLTLSPPEIKTLWVRLRQVVEGACPLRYVGRALQSADEG
jgi:hypothetical protein